jgi:hypothetical protein
MRRFHYWLTLGVVFGLFVAGGLGAVEGLCTFSHSCTNMQEAAQK